MQRFNWDEDQHYILATRFSKHGSMSNLLGHASPPFSSHFLISPSVTGRPLLMMCNTGTLRPSLANLTTVWWSCPLQLFIGWWILPRWERFLCEWLVLKIVYMQMLPDLSLMACPAPHHQKAQIALFLTLLPCLDVVCLLSAFRFAISSLFNL